eukprot:jgi/Botrbrau1/18981/Bobra.0100s0018.1
MSQVRRFRLNESLAEGLVGGSILAGTLLMAVIGFLLSAAIPAPLTTAEAALVLLPQRPLANVTFGFALAVVASAIGMSRWAEVRARAELRRRTAARSAGRETVGTVPIFRPAPLRPLRDSLGPPPDGPAGAPSQHPEVWLGFDAASGSTPGGLERPGASAEGAGPAGRFEGVVGGGSKQGELPEESGLGGV